MRALSLCAEEDSNLHPVIPDQALNLASGINALSKWDSRAKSSLAPATNQTYEQPAFVFKGCLLSRSAQARFITRDRMRIGEGLVASLTRAESRARAVPRLSP